ncbi:MAG: amidohydrolase [Bacteroidetes bacterium]|nr:amidohydrolase [Bacteroidota bacterium]
MKPVNFLLIFLSLTSLIALSQKTKSDIVAELNAKEEFYSAQALKIWGFAEVGYKEVQSSALLQKILSDAGFKIESGVAGMPTAFTATFGSGKPIIGILGEYDALPGLAQEAITEQKPIVGQRAGHACGHHLFGVASAAAAIEVKNWLITTRKSGTIRFYGTPAEEGGSGKVYMVREGLFSDVDAVINWHPGDANDASAGGSLANKTGKFRFYGIASHAAVAPERGRSALDAVEAMNIMTNMMREHVSEKTRIHYVITRGGEAPNVVPAFAEVYYYVRHPKRNEVKETWDRLTRIAQGAAMATDTRVEIEVTGGVYDLLPNQTLAAVMEKNLSEVGGVRYSASEKEFAVRIQKSLSGNIPSLDQAFLIAPSKKATEAGSTDVGDVSWVVPTVGLSAATWVPGTPPHSWQAVAAGGTPIGTKGMMVAAKSMALTAADLFSDASLIQNAWKEFKSSVGENFKYESLLGDRKPALNYRD